MNIDKAKRLAEEHWSFIESLLRFTYLKKESIIEYQAFLYISAFIHGYKHGVSDKNENSR